MWGQPPVGHERQERADDVGSELTARMRWAAAKRILDAHGRLVEVPSTMLSPGVTTAGRRLVDRD